MPRHFPLLSILQRLNETKTATGVEELFANLNEQNLPGTEQERTTR
jgi:hypothetical protein